MNHTDTCSIEFRMNPPPPQIMFENPPPPPQGLNTEIIVVNAEFPIYIPSPLLYMC